MFLSLAPSSLGSGPLPMFISQHTTLSAVYHRSSNGNGRSQPLVSPGAPTARRPGGLLPITLLNSFYSPVIGACQSVCTVVVMTALWTTLHCAPGPRLWSQTACV